MPMQALQQRSGLMAIRNGPPCPMWLLKSRHAIGAHVDPATTEFSALNRSDDIGIVTLRPDARTRGNAATEQ